MKAYWDSSALIKLLHDRDLRSQLTSNQHATLPHALAEIFSTLTKGISFRYSPQDAARMIADLAKELDFIEVNDSEAVAAIIKAGPLGVRGARIHDLLHATAAGKYGAELLFTLDTAGFQGLTGIEIRCP